LNELSPYLRDRQRIAVPDLYVADSEAPDLRAYWLVIRSHYRLIAACLLSVVGLTTLVVFSVTPQYRAKATLMLESQTAPVLDAKIPGSALESSNEYDFFKTQYQILKSRSLAASVIEQLDLIHHPLFIGRPRNAGLSVRCWWYLKIRIRKILNSAAGDDEVSGVPQRVLDTYLRRLSIEPELGTQLVHVAFQTPDPALSARIVNLHVETFIRRGMELRSDAAKNAEQFLQGKLAELKQRVENSELALNAYRREHGVIAFSLDENGKGQMLAERLTNLNNALARIEAERIELEAQHDLVRRGEADSLPAVMQNQLIQNLRQQVAALAAQYASMNNQFNPGYQPLDDLKAKLDQSRVQLAQEVGRAAKGVESNYRAAIARQQMLETEISDVKTQALALNDASLQDAVLAREVDASRNLYKSVIERVRELDVSADAPSFNVSVVDRAEPPLLPASPRKLMSLGASALVGLAGGIGLAFFLEFIDDRLKTSEQIERELRLPGLALVPDLSKLRLNGSGSPKLLPRTAERPVEDADGARLPAWAMRGEVFVVRSDRRSPAAAIYHSICTAVLFSQAGQTPRSIVITSATEGEGKTVTAVNLAVAFAQTGGRVLLVDGDLHRPRCHGILGIANHSGLSDVLTGQKRYQELIHKTAAGLCFLSAGSDCPNPPALLGSQTMRELLAQLSDQYDRIVFDAPPVMPLGDAVVLSTMADGALVIVGAQTSKRVVQEACARLHHVGARIFGVVLNRVDTTAPGYFLYSPYSYYSGNGVSN
jgi:polysaccharide biosynthesis transport protein